MCQVTYVRDSIESPKATPCVYVRGGSPMHLCLSWEVACVWVSIAYRSKITQALQTKRFGKLWCKVSDGVKLQKVRVLLFR